MKDSAGPSRTRLPPPLPRLPDVRVAQSPDGSRSPLSNCRVYHAGQDQPTVDSSLRSMGSRIERVDP